MVVELAYSEHEISEEQRLSTDAGDIRQCLESGIIPAVYEKILPDVMIKEKKHDEAGSILSDSEVLRMSGEEMRKKAMRGYFIREVERNMVYCPGGFILREKSIKRNGNIRYCNNLACRKCKRRCTCSDFKEIDFGKDRTVSVSHRAGDGKHPRNNRNRIAVTGKVVRYRFHPDFNRLNERECLSEHPFGTIKRSLGATCFLLRGKAKVGAEMSLLCMSYNMRRAMNMMGTGELIRRLKTA
jgi:transposase